MDFKPFWVIIDDEPVLLLGEVLQVFLTDECKETYLIYNYFDIFDIDLD